MMSKQIQIPVGKLSRASMSNTASFTGNAMNTRSLVAALLDASVLMSMFIFAAASANAAVIQTNVNSPGSGGWHESRRSGRVGVCS